MTTHNDDGFARNVGRVIEKEDEHIEHIDDIIMTNNDTGSDDDKEDDDRCVRERRADNVFCNLRSHLCSTCHNKNHSDTFQEHFSYFL